jgi:NADH-quinone oxidoreductase subunit H
LPEDEAALVAGFFVEYSSGPFALFFIAEYANLIMMCAVTTLLFFGGFSAPLAILSFIPGSIWFFFKTGFFLFCIVWVRATLPRYRFDQLQRLCWKALLPLALAGFVVNAAIILCFQLISFFFL